MAKAAVLMPYAELKETAEALLPLYPRITPMCVEFTETEQIREGSLQPLDAGRTKELFGDGMVHASMYVRFDALKLD